MLWIKKRTIKSRNKGFALRGKGRGTARTVDEARGILTRSHVRENRVFKGDKYSLRERKGKRVVVIRTKTRL